MRVFGALAIALAVASCQGSRSADRVEGRWASDDGVFVATFDGGAFTSQLVSTGDTVVADGRYSDTGAAVQLRWTSIVANEGRSARCTFAGANRLACEPSAGDAFSMTRVA